MRLIALNGSTYACTCSTGKDGGGGGESKQAQGGVRERKRG